MKPIVILEVANNHMGNVSHGKKIITEFNKVTKKFKNQINFVVKYQYRDSKTFIHKESDDKNKFVKRFNETFLSNKEWSELIDFSSKYYKLACTPFDEISAEKVFKQKFDYVESYVLMCHLCRNGVYYGEWIRNGSKLYHHTAFNITKGNV